MDKFELTIRNGTVATASETSRCDIGISGEKIVAIADRLPPGTRDIDAKGRYVLPGGIDSHCHIEQLSGMGIMSADDFYSGTVSAAFGGTTTIIPFAAQHRGTSVTTTVADYHERARTKAVIDYGFHLIIGDPTDKVLQDELPAAIRGGITSFKVYMTYPKWKLEDYQLLEIMSVAEREGALVMVHAENDDMIRWIAKHLIERGHGAPKYHGVAHSPLAEAEATNRIIMLSRLLGAPVLIVHVSSPEATNTIRAAQTLGARIYAETCPQYLVLTAEDMDRPASKARNGAAARRCATRRRRKRSGRAWATARSRSIPPTTRRTGSTRPRRFRAASRPPSRRWPTAFPASRCACRSCFRRRAEEAPHHQSVRGAGVDQPRAHVRPVPAQGHDRDRVGCRHRDLGSRSRKAIDYSMMHDAVGYTPYEGHVYKGWPQTVLSRGRIVIENNQLRVERGSGKYLARGVPGPVATATTVDGPARQLRKLING
jgi:dihydropyrimidinase